MGVLVSFAVPLFEKGCVFLFCSYIRVSKLFFKISKIIATPVSNLTVLEAHNEFQKLTHLIATKNEELLSGGCGKATGDKFIDKIKELSPLYTQMSQLCRRLNIPWPIKLWWPPHFKH